MLTIGLERYVLTKCDKDAFYLHIKLHIIVKQIYEKDGWYNIFQKQSSFHTWVDTKVWENLGFIGSTRIANLPIVTDFNDILIQILLLCRREVLLIKFVILTRLIFFQITIFAIYYTTH